LLGRVGLTLQGLLKEVLGEGVSDGLDGLFEFAELGAPLWAVFAIKLVDQMFGHPFKVGANGIGGVGGDVKLGHRRLLSLKILAKGGMKNQQGSRIAEQGKKFFLPSPWENQSHRRKL
jgi:hypothetical protein